MSNKAMELIQIGDREERLASGNSQKEAMCQLPLGGQLWGKQPGNLKGFLKCYGLNLKCPPQIMNRVLH
jgi:hypothetical protein